MPAGGHARSRRAWGWHPLRPSWADRVVASTPVRRGDLVLDLGAGTGALTGPLLDRGVRVLAVELHAGRARHLRERFAGQDVHVLEVDLTEVRWPARPFRVVASPPYAVTSALLRHLTTSDRLLSADLVLQGSAARRLAAERRRRWNAEVGMQVPRAAFSPPPRADSVVLRLRLR